MSAPRPTALIADDEPLLRTALVRLLASAWPELEIVAQARNGREAVEQFEALQPQVCFLDVHMPGLSGVDAARLTTISYGKERPVALGSDEEAWSRNRRAVTITID